MSGLIFAAVGRFAIEASLPVVGFVALFMPLAGKVLLPSALALLLTSIFVDTLARATRLGFALTSVLLLAQIAYALVWWQEGVMRYGVKHVLAVNLSAVAALLVVLLLQHRGGIPSISRSAVIISALALWPLLLGFPYLGGI
jgi:hypothetical protein